MPATSSQFLQFFRGTSPYIHAHRGKTLVVYLSGKALANSSTDLIHDLALLRSLGLRLVVVFGSRPQVSAAFQSQTLAESFHGSLRITTAETLPLVTGAAQQLLVRLQAEFSTGLVNSPMHGASVRTVTGNYVYAKPQGILDGVDLQFTGRVRSVAGEEINNQLDGGNIVLVPPYGFSVTGELFNLSALEVAQACAQAVQADKLVLLSDMTALPDPDERSQLTPNELRQHLSDQDAETPGYGEAQTAIQACQQGTARTHIIDDQMPGALLTELYTRDGCGIMVSRDDYDTFRTAQPSDIGGILALLEPLEDTGILVRRSREQLERGIREFVVNERDGMIIGCAALHVFDNQGARHAELACVAVHEDYRTHGRGAQLLAHIERQAVRQGIEQIFSLTTQAIHWFQEHGFMPGKLSDLPDERQALYNYQRNSRILIKPLHSAQQPA